MLKSRFTVLAVLFGALSGIGCSNPPHAKRISYCGDDAVVITVRNKTQHLASCAGLVGGPIESLPELKMGLGDRATVLSNEGTPSLTSDPPEILTVDNNVLVAMRSGRAVVLASGLLCQPQNHVQPKTCPIVRVVVS